MNSAGDPAAALAWLRTPGLIRRRCRAVLVAGERGELRHFAIDRSRLDAAADYVVATMRANYPTLEIPYHSRWRHFAVGGRDRWAALSQEIRHLGTDEIARVRFDLAVVSVLLDAGAGDAWRYVEPETGAVLARSEGLAVASFDLFTAGAFSADPAQPLRADAAALAAMNRSTLERAFQVRGDNPLAGLEGRVLLLSRLGETIAAKPMFGTPARVGGLFDHLAAEAKRCRRFDHLAAQTKRGRLSAQAILVTILRAFSEIWPGRIELAGVNLGDVGRHPAAGDGGLTAGLIPFHKLSQWLAYSLVEPLEEAGIEVTDLDRLTALAEYRNGGLLIDLGVLVAKHPGVLTEPHEAGSEVVVEWRALTVALIDELAVRIREKLGMSAAELPLAKILEGGTWSAGRRIAAELRPNGGPPLRVISDGTLF